MRSRLLTLTLLLVFSGSLFAQSAGKTERTERRAERRARQAMELAQSRAEMVKLVKDTTLVLEAVWCKIRNLFLQRLVICYVCL